MLQQLQQRFAARFRADPAAQAQFVSLVRMLATAEPGTRQTSAVTGAPWQATAPGLSE